MAWADIRRPLKSQAKIRSRVSPCGIYGGQIDTRTGFLRTASVFPRKYYSTIAPCLLLLPEEQTGKAWEPSRKQKTNKCPCVCLRPIDRKILQNLGFGGLNISNSSSFHTENKAINEYINTTEARSCHHCGSVKAINICSERLSAALGIQHAMRMRHTVICDLRHTDICDLRYTVICDLRHLSSVTCAILSSVTCPILLNFFPQYHINRTIFERKLLNTKRVFRFSLQLYLKHFSF